jgi:hypothetical protein
LGWILQGKPTDMADEVRHEKRHEKKRGVEDDVKALL